MGKAGLNCQLVVGSGSAARVVAMGRDVDLSAAMGAIDVTTRGSLGWKEIVVGLDEWEASIDQIWVPSDAALVLLRNAYLNATEIAVKFEDVNSLADASWAALTAYTLALFRKPTTPNGFRYECTRAGTSGAAQPTWPTTVGATVNDPDGAGAQWTCRLAGVGFTGTAIVTGMKRGEPLGDAVILPVTLKGTGPLVKSPAA